MNVIVASTAGFCFGVQRAVSICEKTAEEFDDCVTLGPIIHNDHVIKYLENLNIKAVSGVSEVSPGSTVIIRSHGAGKKEYEELEAIGANIVDATCPDVKRIHDIVREEGQLGRLSVIIGNRDHPEVVAISDWCDECEVFDTAEELSEWLKSGENAQKPLSFVFQTTNSENIYFSSVEIIKKECTNYKVFDTICNATRKRQQEADEISKIADVMVVIGGKNSANSLRLADICKGNCQRVLFIDSAKELNCTDIRISDTVGVTAGASAPAWIIKEVTQKMSEDVKQDDTFEEPETISDDLLAVKDEEPDVVMESDAVAEPEASNDEKSTINDEKPDVAAEPDIIIEEPEAINDEETDVVAEPEPIDDGKPGVVVETDVVIEEAEAIIDERLTGEDETPVATEELVVTEEPVVTNVEQARSDDMMTDANDDNEYAESSSMGESFEEMLERSIKTLHTGQKVTGVVTSITATEVSVDLGAKQSGYIPVSEFTDDSNADIGDVVKIGDTIESFVMRVNDVEGMVMLSKKRLDAIKNWDEIEASRDSKATVSGVVTEENKGGIVVSVKGVRVFVPASQTGLPKSAPMSELVKKTVKLRITEVNQSRRRVVGSIRAVQAEERREKSDRLWDDIENGKEYNGVVKSMTSYGVFVDIGGVDGMIHISELSWTRIKQPSEVMSVGDEVSVYVLSFDKDNRKISLGYKKSEDNPWTKFTVQYAVGDVINVKIVKMMPFGAFAEICPGVDGLIHISQISDHRIGLPSEVLSNGQLVDVMITAIDYERKKVSLSIRALLDPASKPISDNDAEEAADSDKTPVIVYDTDAPPAIIEEQTTLDDEIEDAAAQEPEEPEVVEVPEVSVEDTDITEAPEDAADTAEKSVEPEAEAEIAEVPDKIVQEAVGPADAEELEPVTVEKETTVTIKEEPVETEAEAEPDIPE